MKALLIKLCLICAALFAFSAHAYAASPVATTFNVTASTVGSTLMQLQGADADGTPLIFAFNSSPVHGTVSGFDASTGYFVYTPNVGYVGTDGIFFVVSSGGQTSSAVTCSITVANAKTRIVDTLTNPDGTPRAGKVTFILTQKVQSPAGLIPVGGSASAVLNGLGQFDISLYPSTSLSPQSFYQVWFEAVGGARREILGVYSIPASTTTITLVAHQVIDTNLAAQYTFASSEAINALISGGAGFGVSSFNMRTGSVAPATGDYSFSQISGSVTDAQVPDTITVTNLSADNLSSGTIPNARFPVTLPAVSGVNLTNLNASNLASGTVPDARFPETLPAISAANLTSLNASNLSSGTIPDARFPSTLPLINGANIEGLNGSEINTGTVPAARLGSGTASSTTILRGNNTWATPAALGLVDGSGVADRLSYWTGSGTLASSPFVRVDGDTTEHRGTGGATVFKVSGAYVSGSNNLGALISADPSVVVYGVYKAGIETPIPVRLSSFGGGDVQIGNGSVLAVFKSDAFIPFTDVAYDFGSSSNRWMNGYINSLHGRMIELTGADGTQFLNIHDAYGVLSFQFGTLGLPKIYAIGGTSTFSGVDTTTLKVGDGGTKPTCDSTTRGTFWLDFGATGIKDTVEVCGKSAADSYAWRTIY